MGLTFADDAQVPPNTAATTQPNKDEWRVLLERTGATTPRNQSLAQMALGLSYRTIVFSKSGQVTPDFATPLELPHFPVGNPHDMAVVEASCQLAQDSTSDVSFELYTVVPGTSSVQIGTTYTISAGNHTVSMAALVGTTISAGDVLAMKVTAGAIDAMNLTVKLEIN